MKRSAPAPNGDSPTRSARAHAPVPFALLALVFASGIPALGYQVVWAKVLALRLGHETPATVGAVVACLGGMALGAALGHRLVHRNPRLLRSVAALEAVIGVWGAVTAFGLGPAAGWMLVQPGTEAGNWVQGVVAMVFPLVALLPATAAMGASFPVFAHLLGSLGPGAGPGGEEHSSGRIALAYGLNTLGAGIGCLLAAFVLMPALGFRGALICLALVNGIAAGVAALLDRNTRSTAGVEPVPERDTTLVGAPGVGLGRLRAGLFVMGFLGISHEILGIRLLSQFLPNTVYTFALVLSVFLFGTAGGALVVHRARIRAGRSWVLFAGAGISMGLAGVAARGLPELHDRMQVAWPTTGGALRAELVCIGVIFLISTAFLGGVFSFLATGVSERTGRPGQAMAVNCLGGALGGVLMTPWILPLAGLKLAWVLVALGCLAVWPMRLPVAVACATIVGLLGWSTPGTADFVQLPPGGRLLELKEGAMASVAVVEEPGTNRVLKVNNRFQMGGTGAATAQRRQGVLPLLLHPAPKRALFLGPGTGITPGAALAVPGLAIDAVEIIPEVISMMRWFDSKNANVHIDPRARFIAADARRFIRATTNRYDVVVADLFHPARDGAGALYSEEQFRAIRDLLAPGGLVCQWLPVYQLDEGTLRRVLRAFLSVGWHAHLILLQPQLEFPVVGLVGSREPLALTHDLLERRDPGVRKAARDVGIPNSIAVLGSFVAGQEALGAFVGASGSNTDDRPAVMFEAPWTNLDPAGRRGFALDLITRDWGMAGASLGPNLPQSTVADLKAYWAARAVYLAGMVAEIEGRLEAAADAYLESTSKSIQFTPAYARCVTLIQIYLRTNPAEARRLFQRLESARPDQPLARQLLGAALDAAAPP